MKKENRNLIIAGVIVAILNLAIGIVIGALVTSLVMYEFNQNRRISVMERFLNRVTTQQRQVMPQNE